MLYDTIDNHRWTPTVQKRPAKSEHSNGGQNGDRDLMPPPVKVPKRWRRRGFRRLLTNGEIYRLWLHLHLRRFVNYSVESDLYRKLCARVEEQLECCYRNGLTYRYCACEMYTIVHFSKDKLIVWTVEIISILSIIYISESWGVKYANFPIY